MGEDDDSAIFSITPIEEPLKKRKMLEFLRKLSQADCNSVKKDESLSASLWNSSIIKIVLSLTLS